MLKDLQIRNFALIEELELSFYSGFSVLSGETGAGKSIIIDALGLLLGARASAEMMRTGAKTTEVAGSFTLTPSAQKLLETWGMLDHEELIIAREINQNGRNKCWINGRLATVSQLAELGVHLVDIVGQHDSQSLLQVEGHSALLDAYGGAEHEKILIEADQMAEEWLQVRAEQRRLQRDERERNRRIDLLTFQVEEIKKAALQPKEDEKLEADRTRLANLDRIRQSIHFILTTLGDGFDERESLLHDLSATEGELQRAASLDSDLSSFQERYAEISLNLHDFYGELRNYLEELPANPNLLQEIELRLELIDGLQRKYGQTVDEILKYGEEAARELDNLKNASIREDSLAAESEKLQKKWLHKADKLTESRKRIAHDLEAAIEKQLADLSMESTRFKAQFSQNDIGEPTLGGQETIEFMMAPNLGEDLKPLAKIASGGELSRVMLAIKAILIEAEQTPTVIFDEIDAGIGGRTAVQLGEKLHSLSKLRQVLCVTHLPVVAGFGKQHYSVQKTVQAERTKVKVHLLQEQERLEELTRMLGGTAEQTVTFEHARELLQKNHS